MLYWPLIIPFTDEGLKRRRRRLPQATSANSGLSRSPSLPLKTPDVVRSVASSFHGPSSPPAVYTTKTVQASPFVPPRLPQPSPSSSRLPQPSSSSSRLSTKTSPPHVPTRRSMSPITHAALSQSSPKRSIPSSTSPTSLTSPSSAPSTLDWRHQDKGDLKSPGMVGGASAVCWGENKSPRSEGGSYRPTRSSFRRTGENGVSGTSFLASKREKDNKVNVLGEFPKRRGKTSANDCEKASPEAAVSLVNECESYLKDSKTKFDSSRHRKASTLPSIHNQSGGFSKQEQQQNDTNRKSPTQLPHRQKNGGGDSEGNGKESERLVLPKEVKKGVNFGVLDTFKSDNEEELAAEPSESPEHLAIKQEEVLAIAGELMHGRALSQRSLDGDIGENRRVQSPEPQSILKRRHSRDDLALDRAMTPEPQSILKRKSWSRGSSSRASSVDTLDGELVPILKKKSSTEDIDHFEPKPILKKKSSTDDELEDRPKSILKSARSGEDLHCDSGVVSPTPILKRGSRNDSEGEELKPILKRRDTTDGVRLRIHLSDGEEVLPGGRLRSDSAPDTAYSSSHAGVSSYPQSTDSSPSRGACQRPSILKKRWHASQASDGDLRIDDSNDISRVGINRSSSPPSHPYDGRPLSVNDRVAVMETGSTPPQGARPKARTSSFSSRSGGNAARQSSHRRSSWASMDRWVNCSYL